MMTLRRFRALAGSFGADLQRWPEQERDAARALLRASPEAYALREGAHVLDAAITAASMQEQVVSWRQPGEQDAAMARLRAGVAARLSVPAVHRPRRQLAWRPATWEPWVGRAGVLGLTASGVLAVVAGLLIGAMYAAEPAPDTLMSMLQPAPIHLLED